MDYFGPREVLIVVGVLVILAIILDGARRIKRNRYENLQMSSRKLRKASAQDVTREELDALEASQFPSGRARIIGVRDEGDLQQVEDTVRRSNGFGFDREPEQEVFDLDNSIYERQRAELTQQAQPQKSAEKPNTQPEEVLVIHLMANKGEKVAGQQLLDAVLSAGLRYGAMKIFHRHLSDDGSGPVLFSMANLVNPGTFDLNTMGDLEVPGVTLFMALDDIEDPVDALNIMIEAVDSIVGDLQLNVMDESRSSMTRNTIDHYRQRARDVSVRRDQSS
ncbi:cell division protein ZipA [Porticoccaceae bacterium]|nr:cell division protein ZipA [Porticoccaceae bacterium]MDB9724436.1 cell division protein ZipA [bacterium]MDB4077235.1 cell division protein ZipA [Porticoccaceae bacterium]MDB4262633.1 cell division protein ZipA [Porticoccaceae bacterium]MDB4308723.1 cell division protein ZipA [Porticoccaceae bacterium]